MLVQLNKKQVLKGTRRRKDRHYYRYTSLLSKDVKFKDLGLLVVDEEQRFGVKHKEALKELKKEG